MSSVYCQILKTLSSRCLDSWTLFCPLFCDVPWALSIWVILLMCQLGWALLGQMFSAFRHIVDFCDNFWNLVDIFDQGSKEGFPRLALRFCLVVNGSWGEYCHSNILHLNYLYMNIYEHIFICIIMYICK